MIEFLKKVVEAVAKSDWVGIWQLLSGIQHWNSVEGWLARIIIFVLAVYLLVFFSKKALEAYIGFADVWKRAGLPLQVSAEKRNALRRRQQFCRMLRSDLDALNKSESWNDQSFTDLEAEVEADGGFYVSRIDKLLGRRSRGLRRVPSLIRAIESSAEQWLLLVGEPGSGKSVALRHLAYQLAENGARSSDPNAKIPLYINLKELPPPPPEGPHPDWIRSFVLENIRRNDADTAAYVKEHWDAYLGKGIWFFLFDSFDEIPAIMHAPTGSSIIKEYSEAIRKFLAGMNDCRGIIASREFKGPESLPWPKLRILPMSSRRRDQLVENTFLSHDQKELVRRHLSTNDNLLQTPLFLTLLGRYVKDENRAPPHDHDLLIRHIHRLARRDPEYVKSTHGFTPEELLDGATELAVLMASSPGLSLAPMQDEITAVLDPGRLRTERLNRLMGALVDVKIGRNDVRVANIGERRFSFAHRRYQEVLFVRYLASYPAHIPPLALLMDLQWREYTVALLQTEATEVLIPLLEEATRILADFSVGESIPTLPGFGEGLTYFQWGPEVHLLELLQEGLSRRQEDVPPSLEREVGKLLSLRWEQGDFDDRSMVIRLGGLLPQEQLVKYLEFALKNGTSELQELAFRRIDFLRAPPPSLDLQLHSRLAIQLLLASSRAELFRLEAISARLLNPNVKTLFRRSMVLRRVFSPLLMIARGLMKTMPRNQKKPRRFITSDQFFIGLLTAFIVFTNAGVFALVLSAFPLDLERPIATAGLIFPVVIVAGLSLFVLKHVVAGTTDLHRPAVVVYGGIFLILLYFSSPHVFIFRGLITQNWVLFWIGIGLLVVVNKGFLPEVSGLIARRRQRARLLALRATGAPTVPLPLQAESLDELDTWISEQRTAIIPDIEHRRSLARIILKWIETPVATPVQEPPLLVYCCQKKPTGETLTVFRHLQASTMETGVSAERK